MSRERAATGPINQRKGTTMQGNVTISLPHDRPPVSLESWRTYVVARISSRGCAIAISGDDPEQVATWFEHVAAEVRSRALEQSVADAALSNVERERWPTVAEVSGEVYAPSCGQAGCSPAWPCGVCQSLAGATGGDAR